MRIMARLITKLHDNTRGATAIEYALIASLISVAAIMSFETLGGKVEKKYDGVNVAMKAAM